MAALLCNRLMLSHTPQSLQKYVCLTKADSLQSLGLTIVGGDGSEGIYVDKLATGGLAHLDGRIRKGW